MATLIGARLLLMPSYCAYRAGQRLLNADRACRPVRW
jgi:hypothetical protein